MPVDIEAKVSESRQQDYGCEGGLHTVLAAGLFLCSFMFAGECTNLSAEEPSTASPLVLKLDNKPAAGSSPSRPVLFWNEARTTPRPLAVSYLRIDLQSPEVELVVMVGDDPDDAGPAEASLTMPIELMTRYSAIAGINANAFAKVHPLDRLRPWSEGMHVDVIGMAVSDGSLRSPLDNPRYSNSRVAFWVDSQNTPAISRPPQEGDVEQAVGDFCAVLLQEGLIVPEAGGPRHPRSALGFDETRQYLFLVVVDGRRDGYSDGVTMHELARLMKRQGCSQAINLDGGGSSVMLYRERESDELQTVNRPSDGKHRPIPTMIGVRRRGVSVDVAQNRSERQD